MSMPEMWLSKYALTGGVKAMSVSKIEAGYAWPSGPGFLAWDAFLVGKDAHYSKQEAVAAAEIMRNKKIASLEKQLAKLKAMKFE